MFLGFHWLLWVFAAIQVCGCCTLMLNRLANSKQFNGTFFLALLLVGVAAFALLVGGWSQWVYGCPTLAAMTLGATFDGGRNVRQEC